MRRKNTPGTIKVDNSPAVKRWLNRLQPISRKASGNNLIHFFDWLVINGGKFSDYTPDQLAEYQTSASNGSRFDILNLVQEWINNFEGSRAYKHQGYVAVRSFFIHNRSDLPPDKTFKIQGEKKRVLGELKIDEIQKIILSSNVMYKAIFVSAFQGALDIRGIEDWSNTGLEKLKSDLEKKPGLIRIDLPGRKKNEDPYYTLVGKDVILALRDWMVQRAEIVKQREDPGTIFINQQGEPIKRSAISTYWLKHSRKIGLVGKGEAGDTGFRTGKNIHELRDSFRTIWAKTDAAAQVSEFLMGHQIDKLGYNKFYRDQDYVETEYQKAASRLNILSAPILEGYVETKEVNQLRQELIETKKESTTENAKLRAEMLEMRKTFFEMFTKRSPEARNVAELISLGKTPQQAKAELERQEKEVNDAVKELKEPES